MNRFRVQNLDENTKAEIKDLISRLKLAGPICSADIGSASTSDDFISLGAAIVRTWTQIYGMGVALTILSSYVNWVESNA